MKYTIVHDFRHDSYGVRSLTVGLLSICPVCVPLWHCWHLSTTLFFCVMMFIFLLKKYQWLFLNRNCTVFRNGTSNLNPSKDFTTTVLKMLLMKYFNICESTNYDGFPMQRCHFVVWKVFTITTHETKGQIFEIIGVDIWLYFFIWRMLYVAFSRTHMRKTLNIHLLSSRYIPHQICNVVRTYVLKTLTINQICS